MTEKEIADIIIFYQTHRIHYKEGFRSLEPRLISKGSLEYMKEEANWLAQQYLNDGSR